MRVALLVSLLTMALGGNFLDYDYLEFGDKHHVEHVEHAAESHDTHTAENGHVLAAAHANEPHGSADDDHQHDETHDDGHEEGEHGFFPQGQHLGIFLVELGVGITVTSVMTMIFYCFAGREQTE